MLGGRILVITAGGKDESDNESEKESGEKPEELFNKFDGSSIFSLPALDTIRICTAISDCVLG